jgi:hypothetical protein
MPLNILTPSWRTPRSFPGAISTSTNESRLPLVVKPNPAVATAALASENCDKNCLRAIAFILQDREKVTGSQKFAPYSSKNTR